MVIAAGTLLCSLRKYVWKSTQVPEPQWVSVSREYRTVAPRGPSGSVPTSRQLQLPVCPSAGSSLFPPRDAPFSRVSEAGLPGTGSSDAVFLRSGTTQH